MNENKPEHNFKKGDFVTNGHITIIVIGTGDRGRNKTLFTGVIVQQTDLTDKVHKVGEYSESWHGWKFKKVDESGQSKEGGKSVDVAFGVDKWDAWRAWFSIGVQKFHLQNSENKEHAEWYEKMLRIAFTNLTGQEGNKEREIDKKTLEFIRDCAENWDCDPDSHTYNLPCRKCEAAKLYEQQQKSEQ